ncbi:hypothetical protein ABZ686_31975 [Streptomyces sp. NPDC006992]|uniref:hypothetical protein n=1 Tax=Streptomyces sp. NPDC006992 TaxID=3155601 RepID=UPI0034038A24
MSAPAFAVPATATSSATMRQAGENNIQAIWHNKNAKNVSGGPSSGLACMPVYARGGKPTLGEVCFQPYGDKFWVKDRRADGMHIEMRALYSGNTQTVFNCKDYKGAAAGWTACGFAKEMKEDQTINFAALVYDGTTRKYKGRTAYSKS